MFFIARKLMTTNEFAKWFPLSQKHREEAGAGSSCGRIWTVWVLFPAQWPWTKPLRHSVQSFSDDYQVMVPSSQGYGGGLINELVMCFEIHWFDLSACTSKALVPVLIYVQTDYSCLLLLSPNRVISSLLVLLLYSSLATFSDHFIPLLLFLSPLR